MKFREVTDDRELRIYLKQLYPDYNTHVVAIDELKNIKPQMKQIIIVNYKKRENGGTHWVAVIAKEERYAIFFDSYGLAPPQEILQFLRKYKEEGIVKAILMNIRKIQPIKDKGSKACGYFILNLLRYYIKEKQPIYEAIGNLSVSNTLAYGRKIRKKYFYWLHNETGDLYRVKKYPIKLNNIT